MSQGTRSVHRAHSGNGLIIAGPLPPVSPSASTPESTAMLVEKATSLHLAIEKLSTGRGKRVEELEARVIAAARDAKVRIHEQSEIFREKERQWESESNSARRTVEQLASRQHHLERALIAEGEKYRAKDKECVELKAQAEAYLAECNQLKSDLKAVYQIIEKSEKLVEKLE